jgi:PAS domain S-box-containing protein
VTTIDDTARDAWAAAERALSRAEALQRTAAALGHALRTDEVAEVALRQGMLALGAGRGVFGLLMPDGHTIRTVKEIGFRPGLLEQWATFDIEDDLPLPEAIRLRGPLILRSHADLLQRYPQIKGTPAEGGPAVVLPLIYEDRALGGMYFRYSDPNSVEEADKGYLAALGQQCAAALERARLYEAEALAWREAELAQRRIGFLAKTGEALSAAEDVGDALPRIAKLAVPEIADWAAVFLLDTDRAIRLVALQHRDPERLDHVRAFLDRRPPQFDDTRGVGAAIATGEVSVVADARAALDEIAESTEIADSKEISDSGESRAAAGHTQVSLGEARNVLDESAIRSLMYCPLQGDTAVFGAAVLATTGDRAFTDADATFGAELGRRVGAALEKVELNTRLRERIDEIRDRDERLELALAASKTGFWEWNLVTERMVWSDEICRLHGVPTGTEIVGIDGWLELIHPSDRDDVRAQVEAAFESGVFESEYRVRAPNGKVRWTRSAARVFHAPGGSPLRMIGIGQDITQRRATELERERLLEAEQRAGEIGQVFIGVVSHELRTPITMILGGAQLLSKLEKSDKTLKPEHRSELIEGIEAEAERLYRLTEDLLVLTRVERGGLDIGSEPVLLRRVLDQVVASESARWPNVRISLHADLDLPVVLGDATYVEQLARNLVANAAKYGGGEGEIEIEATHNDVTVEVRVLDHGPGIAEADLERVFELFYRSPLTAKKATGAGIGLFVCAALARAMGGRVWARNRPEGGSEFGFTLRTYVGESAEELAAMPGVAVGSSLSA